MVFDETLMKRSELVWQTLFLENVFLSLEGTQFCPYFMITHICLHLTSLVHENVYLNDSIEF